MKKQTLYADNKVKTEPKNAWTKLDDYLIYYC